jgi:hypothetical protein
MTNRQPEALAEEQPGSSAVREAHGPDRAASGERAGHLALCYTHRGRPVKTGTMETMICVPCRQRHHQDCPGGTWCDCQHLPAQDARQDAVEPPLSWVRQG